MKQILQKGLVIVGYSKKISRVFALNDKQENLGIKVRILVAIWHLNKILSLNGNGFFSNEKLKVEKFG